MPAKKSPNIVASKKDMETPYKDVCLTYRNKVKPLIARIESERSFIPEDVVFDTATTFENIAFSEDASLNAEEKNRYLHNAGYAMQHCLSVCYNHLTSTRYRRVMIFQKRANRSFLLAIEKGKVLNDINAGLKEFERHYKQCDISEQVSREREVEDLPHYMAAYDALNVPYEIVRKYEPHMIINNTATTRELTFRQGLAIAIRQGIIWGIILEVVFELVKCIFE